MNANSADTSETNRIIRPLARVARLAKGPAVKALTERLEGRGFSPPVAKAISRGIVDPADARTRLDRLTPLRVPGGTMYALDCMLWTPALIPYPANSREASNRHFPVGAEDTKEEGGAYPPIRQPRAPKDAAVLDFEVSDNAHLTWSLDRSMSFLQGNNSLNESIGEQGVMVPLIASVAEIRHADGSPPITLLTTPDGSSRTASALTILDLQPAEVVYEFGESERQYRQFISDTLATLDRPSDEASQKEIEQVRALQVPARLLLDFTPDVAGVDFAMAVDSMVHLVHVEPPKQWDEAGSYDAKAEAVLDEMVNFEVIDGERREFLAGMLSPEEAAKGGFPVHQDERAATLIRVFRAEQSHEAVKQGIRVLSPSKYARREEKVKIAVELALRAQRASLSAADARIARTTLRSAYLERELWKGKWTVTELEPAALRKAALKEIKKEGAGPHTRELAMMGIYWLAIHGVLREAHFFYEKEKRDGRNPQRIITDLMRRPWGVQVLHQAVVDGRAGIVPRRIDDHGRLIKNPAGDEIEMNNQWLRGQVVPEGAPIDADDDDMTPVARLRTRTAAFVSRVDMLDDAHADLRDVEGSNGQVLIDEEGWESDQATEVQERLNDLGRRLVIYGHIWDVRNSDPEQDDEVD